MVIKYGFLTDCGLVFLPDNAPWEIFCRDVSPSGYEDNGLYLRFDGEERALSDAGVMCCGRSLPGEEIRRLHEDAVNTIYRRMAEDPGLRVIDIDAIITELLRSGYEARWVEQGWMEP